MIKPGIWRTRGGIVVAVQKKIAVNYMGPNGPGTAEFWSGCCLDCGARFTWQLDGSYSPVQRHDLDLMSKSSAHGYVPQGCKTSHFLSREVSGSRKKK